MIPRRLIRIFSALCFCLALSVPMPAAVHAQEAPADTAAPDVKPEPETGSYKIEKPTYVYKSGENRDPFRSLIVEVEEEDVVKAPIESYDVSQMKLLGIVSDKKGDYALVVLPDGKSYTIREGMGIGLHNGRVADIRSDEVLVQEPKKDYKGKVRLEDSFLKLRKEGDK